MIHSAAFSLSLVVSLFVALAIILTQRFHGHLTHDSHSGVQKLHHAPTPRVGGVALCAGAVAGGLLLPEGTRALWWVMSLSALPALVFGLIEDVTKRVGVKTRLLATICSGLIFCVASGYHVAQVGLPGLDLIFAFAAFAIPFTAFAVGGVANAINLIDGVNGLASGTSIIILAGFGVVAAQVGDQQLLGISLVLAGALGGFFLMNFPMGRIFLGDAGAYATGFMLAALAVALPARNPEVSPLVGLLALSYPVTETMVSIHRRLVRAGTNPGQADRLHLHSLIYRSRARRLAGILGAPQLRNALSGLVVMGLPFLSTVLMVLFRESTPLLLVAIALVTVVYLVIYRKVALLGGITLALRPRAMSEA
ncbi:MraY family glycosyltransferase [Rhodobacter capsulatus]|jgi:UDP-N-acetylmuramyl pentapeptide phosphotransferase/UDP-N-acetylglucosamine-1-phosphate transferase|uniref:Glycosyl transferase, family 4 n=1 Tax=Rhodobacter capsulatus (strain ATCC BAA-309 / NBRC 16581 / SB1003) TaxID=272942 RepID=D5AUN7_RHOCB|nr:glycosyltransferase [Rhodobacter capsulatus]ADE85676.1 glycosyl transferase, family 4 [Rhodobacter capsulatus SB 1003]ETD76455.1 glycosyl transferase family 4 [Rhodobacter capsulatus B6]ETD82000.1 glycosyl transferase family 4 [Rhodobacter capsulatus YW1]ETD90735.1 glycosyl transferase family 4 [Rhodobacter capsulatus YW2]MDS0927407.1 glycosyltransferase [Rhodobacter capsulatus]